MRRLVWPRPSSRPSIVTSITCRPSFRPSTRNSAWPVSPGWSRIAVVGGAELAVGARRRRPAASAGPPRRVRPREAQRIVARRGVGARRPDRLPSGSVIDALSSRTERPEPFGAAFSVKSITEKNWFSRPIRPGTTSRPGIGGTREREIVGLARDRRTGSSRRGRRRRDPAASSASGSLVPSASSRVGHRPPRRAAPRARPSGSARRCRRSAARRPGSGPGSSRRRGRSPPRTRARGSSTRRRRCHCVLDLVDRERARGDARDQHLVEDRDRHRARIGVEPGDPVAVSTRRMSSSE